MAKCFKILIAGFSGAGKTSLLKALKPQSPEDWELFDDLDQLILKTHGKNHSTLASLIEEVGWEKFRLWERQALEGWLKEESKGVLALGGGTLSPLVWELFSPSRKITFCHLDVPFNVAWARLNLEISEPRPLVKLGELKLHELYCERKKIFDLISWRLDASRPLQELVTEFWQKVNE